MSQILNLTRLVARRVGIDGADREENRGIVLAAGLFAIVAMVLRVIFWAYTARYWEDALITCLHSENFASGLGMTHHRPGEPPLHGFTSPLSVLVPVIGDLMHVGFGVDFLKLVSIPAAALTVLFVMGLCMLPAVRLGLPLAAMAMGYVAVEHHQILWGMSGMETQLSVLILLASIYYVAAWKPVAVGVSLGLCMLVRPDYAFWTLIVGAFALVRAPRDLPKVVGIAVAVYLPWILFTLWEYGSPLPNTVVAKGLGYPQWWEKVAVVDFHTVKRHTWMMLAEQMHALLGPTFAGHGAGMHIFFTNGPESPLGNVMFVFAVLGTLAIVLQRQWSLWPLAACVVAYSVYYVYAVPVVFGWYKVPWVATLLLLSARGIQATTEWLPGVARTRARAGFAIAYLAVFVAVLPVTFHTERQIQEHVENAVRRPAGLFLREHMKPEEAVGCEPLGYMSYYSRGNVYDWPGLASRTVTSWSKEHPGERSLEGMIHGLQPEWLFLRDMEVLYWFKNPAWLREHYHPVRRFEVDPERAREIRWLDRNIDTRFVIYKRNRPEDAVPYDESLWPTKERFHGAAAPPPLTWRPTD